MTDPALFSIDRILLAIHAERHTVNGRIRLGNASRRDRALAWLIRATIDDFEKLEAEIQRGELADSINLGPANDDYDDHEIDIAFADFIATRIHLSDYGATEGSYRGYWKTAWDVNAFEPTTPGEWVGCLYYHYAEDQ